MYSFSLNSIVDSMVGMAGKSVKASKILKIADDEIWNDFIALTFGILVLLGS
jgi:hypothetical protein